MPEEDSHSANACDMEGGTFQVTFILDYKINNFSDIASLIKVSDYVIDRDGSGKGLGV